MRISFRRVSKNLAGLLSGLAFALSVLASGQSRGAIVMDTDPNSTAALAGRFSSGVIVDWTWDCDVQSMADIEVPQRPSLPSVSPEEALADKEMTPTDLANTDASDEWDYVEYKYGRFGRQFGENHDQNPVVPLATDESSQMDDPTASNDSSANDDANNLADSSESDEYQCPAETDDAADNDMDIASRVEKYYRNESLENLDAQDSGDSDTQRADGAMETEEGMFADNESTEESAGGDEGGNGSTLASAVLAIASNWAEETVARYGFSTSQFARLLSWPR